MVGPFLRAAMRYLEAFRRGDFPPPSSPEPGELLPYVWHCMQPCDCQQARLVQDGRELWRGSLWVHADERPWEDLPGALSPQEELYTAVHLVVGFLLSLGGAPQ